MGLPVAELSEENLPGAARPLLSSVDNGASNMEETNVGAVVVRNAADNGTESGAEKKPEPVTPVDSTIVVEAQGMITDASGSQSGSAIDVKIDHDSSENSATRGSDPSTEVSTVPLVSETLTGLVASHLDPAGAESDDVLGVEKPPSTDLGDLGDATFRSADVPLIQHLADVVEVISVVTNDSEEPSQRQELPQPPPADAPDDAPDGDAAPTVTTEVGLSQTTLDSADHFKDVVMMISEPENAKPLIQASANDDIVMAESAIVASTDHHHMDQGGEAHQENVDHDEKILEADNLDVMKQLEPATGSDIEGSRDIQAGPDIDSFLSGGDEKEEENGENEPEGADYEVEAAHQVLPISERRKQKKLEVFVGGLDKETTEEDLTSVFKTVGDVVEVRLMMNPQTGKNKGYAFIRYATTALAKRAAQELERVEIRGRSCGVLPSEENDTLFLGNINKSWKKETVLDALKMFGIENVEDITLMEDPQLEGVNRGFAFIEFNTHKEALSAFRRLQQTDAIFGSTRPAKVAWAQPLNEPDEDTMSQVKSIFVDGMPPSWDEEKVKEHFGIYGIIERIVLARNMLSAKRKDFGFINYVDRDAALLCIEAVNNTEISDGEIKMKVKVTLAKPQTKSKPIKGETRSGYPSGYRGDYRLGVGPIGVGMGVGVGMGMTGVGLGNLGIGMGMGIGRGIGLQGGMELLPYDALSGWSNIGSNIPRFNNQIRFKNMRDYGFGMTTIQRPEKKTKRSGKRNNKELDVKSQLFLAIKDEHATSAWKKENNTDGTKTIQESPQNGDSHCVLSSDLGNVKPPHTIDVASKSTLDMFECSTCGFGFDSIGEYEIHKKTKVHKVIEGFRKDQKLNNKTPLSLLHEYASRHHCEVHYETEAETNGPFEVTVLIGASSGGTTNAIPTKGCGIGRNKARAKQMAAASAVENILEKVSESELIKPGQSRQRFGERERSNHKGKGGNNGGGSGSIGVGGNRNSRGKSNNDWRFVQNSSNSSSIVGISNIGGGVGGGGGKNKHNYNSSDLFFANGRNASYIGNPNAIPLNGYNDFVTAGRRNNFVERFSNHGVGGFNSPFQDLHGRVATHNSETYNKSSDRIQSGRGYGNPKFGGRDFVVGGSGIGSGNFSNHDLVETVFANRELPSPPLLNFNGHDLPPIEFRGGNCDSYETSGLKRHFVPMDDEARFVDAQRALPHQRFEAIDQASIHSNTNAQGFGIQQFFSEAPRSSGARLQEQTQFNPYNVQPQPQGLSIGHKIVQSSHIPNQHTNMSIAMVGVPTLANAQNGSPYSIYEAASQPNTSLPTCGYTNMNQDYLVNPPSIPEMSQGNTYQSQTTYGAPFGIIPQNVPSQVVGNFASMQNCVQQQSFY